jgi:hypothetical protein
MISNLYAEIPLGKLRLAVSFEYEHGWVSIESIDVTFRRCKRTIHNWARHADQLQERLAVEGRALVVENRENLLEHQRWYASL